MRLPLVDDSRTTPANGDPVAPLRELPTTVYLPPQQAPAPLVVLAHGYNGHPDKFTDLANHWAANGFVVAVPRFPMSYAGTPHSSMGDVDGQAGDITFVIDEMLRLARTDERFDDRIDADRIGVFGLSLGSLTVWNTAFGQCCGDDRIDALIQSDGWLPLPVERIDRPLPVMVIHSDADPIFPYDEVRSTVEQLPSSPVMLTVHGAMHAAVGENTPTPADQAYRIATTVFWRRHLCGRPDEPFPAEVQIDGVATLDE